MIYLRYTFRVREKRASTTAFVLNIFGWTLTSFIFKIQSIFLPDRCHKSLTVNSRKYRTIVILNYCFFSLSFQVSKQGSNEDEFYWFTACNIDFKAAKGRAEWTIKQTRYCAQFGMCNFHSFVYGWQKSNTVIEACAIASILPNYSKLDWGGNKTEKSHIRTKIRENKAKQLILMWKLVAFVKVFALLLRLLLLFIHMNSLLSWRTSQIFSIDLKSFFLASHLRQK